MLWRLLLSRMHNAIDEQTKKKHNKPNQTKSTEIKTKTKHIRTTNPLVQFGSIRFARI